MSQSNSMSQQPSMSRFHSRQMSKAQLTDELLHSHRSRRLSMRQSKIMKDRESALVEAKSRLIMEEQAETGSVSIYFF